MSSFSWLHFTDLHFGAGRTDSEWGVIFSNLMDDVNELKNNNNLEFDAVFFTGDMVNKGDKSEFEKFNHCLKQLKKELFPDKDPIFFAVPGNHDLARPKPDDPYYYTLISKWEFEKERQKIWDWEKDYFGCQFMETIFKNYSEWWNDDKRPFKKSTKIIDGRLPGEFRFSDTVNGLKIAIIGLNSSFLQLHDLKGNNSLEMNVSQYNKLFEDQFEASDLKKNHDIAMLLTHHPVNRDFFNERGLDQYNKYIYPAGRFNLHLCGHVHENVYNERRSLFNKKFNRVYPCCSLFGREKYNLWVNGKVKESYSRRHGYSMGQIEKSGNKLNIRIWPRTINKSLIFVKDTDLCTEDHKAYLESEDDLTITEKPIEIEKTEKISISKTKLKSSKDYPAPIPKQGIKLKTPRIFISYSHKDKDIVDEIDQDLQSQNIKLTRDIRDLNFNESIKQFMKKIRRSDFAIIVISESFLKSHYCMFEVLEFIKDENYKDRILPIILEDYIFSPEQRLKYIKCWQNRIKNFKNDLDDVELENLGKATSYVKLFSEINMNIDEFLDNISDMLNLSFKDLKKENYKTFLDFIGIKDLELEPKKKLEIPETYISWIKTNYSHMDAEKLFGKQAFPLSLPEIFIPLYSNDPGIKEKKEKYPEQMKEKQKPIDIELLIDEYERLLIEGHAGSGKTTILKHLIFKMASNNLKPKAFKNLNGYLPILITLNDVNDYFTTCSEDKKRNIKSFGIIRWFTENKMENIIDYSIVEGFIKQKKAILLLDGLDELNPAFRDAVVSTFSTIQNKYNKVKLIITSRPNGIIPKVLNLFPKRHISVQSLIMDQISIFIRKWFGYLYKSDKGPGERTANSMINEIKVHETIGKLIDNPLILTSVCILYHDDKQLPAQRAELYKKFVDNMLYRRFGNDDEKVLGFLQRLAFEVHKTGDRTFGNDFAVQILTQVNPFKNKDSYNMKTLFEEIESKCGLLKFENGEYYFWHLTFQEFLTASYHVDNAENLLNEINIYWGKYWYKEVIELYISLISLQSKKTANKIVKNALDKDDKSPFKNWIVAANSLYDIHKDRRDTEVLKYTQDKLISMFSQEKKPTVLGEAGEILGWLGDPRDLREFVEIEGGDYELEDGFGLEEKKFGKVKIEPFAIGKYPLTVSWYGEFMKDKGYDKEEFWSEVGWKFIKSKKIEYPRFWNDREWSCPNFPVIGVSWYEVNAFCDWLTRVRNDGKVYRLPTEEEWQFAAAGQNKRKYPWGNEWDKNKCNCFETEIGKTSSVGIFKRGATQVTNIYDMSGNVWEWCSTVGCDNRVIRGGCWLNVARDVRSAVRSRLGPDFRDYYTGFRLARGHEREGR